MIDGDGRPRPIVVVCTAEIKVEGSNNVVGDKAVLSKTVTGNAFQKGKADEEGDEERLTPETPEGHDGQAGLKRVRGEIERLEVEPKRVRRG